METKDFIKEIQQRKLSELHVDPSLNFFQEQPDTERIALKLSLAERGKRGLYSAVLRDDKLVLIDGIRSHAIEMKQHGPDHQVLVWVIQDAMTDDDIQWYRIDRRKSAKMLTTDIVSEYKFRNKHMPSNQGKKDKKDEEYRRRRIAKEIGVSETKLTELLRIDRRKPAFLKAIDSGAKTLKEVLSDIKKLEQKEKEDALKIDAGEQPEPFTPDLDVTNKHIDLHEIPTCCPACNRPFNTIQWKEIPLLFNYKRTSDENQTDWLEAVH